MGKSTKTILGLLIGVIFLCSCKTYKVTYMIKKSDKIDKVAVISTFVGNMQKDYLKFGDISIFQGIMNDKINSISSDLMVLFKNYADIYRDTVASFVQQSCNCEVLYGDKLHSNPGFISLKDSFDFKKALITKDNFFPKITISSNDINPFKWIYIPDLLHDRQKMFKFKDDEPYSFLSTSGVIDTTAIIDSTNTQESLVIDTTNIDNELNKIIPTICKKIGVNYVVASYSFLSSVHGTMYTRGRIYLITYFFLYDKSGDCLAWGNNELTANKGGTPINGGKIEQYPEEMNKFPILIDPIIKEIINNYPNY